MIKKELYFSVDIESDGPIPGPNSMLSFAAAVFTEDGKMLETFSKNLETLPEAKGDPHTMKWWKSQPKAWEACRKDLVDPKEAMNDFVEFVNSLCKKHKARPVFVGYPAGFDFMFVYWYLIKFAGKSPFSFSALDIKSYASAILKLPYRESTKRNMPKKWFKGVVKHTHLAEDDAVGQGQLFANMRSENLSE